jgi:phosphopantothenoylcysteine decarboxylase / phosphopantothenate---cysteine ligase
MKVALGVSGGIAAYKAAEIVRLLMDRGCTVQVVMTHAAQEFVRPLTFAALSGQKVITGMFSEGPAGGSLDSAIEHIGVAQDCDVLVVAPATANIIAKFAQGIADDFLTTLYLATKAPVIVAPAMNVNMWEHPATRANIETLRQRGNIIVEPGSGYLACGMVGAGRLAENEIIVSEVLAAFAPQDFSAETVLITAGPTREPIDPVRYISNRSSGKMGYALAEAALRRGAKVVLVTGPVALQPPAGADVVHVDTAAQMRRAVLDRAAEATVVIKAAAVADYQLKVVAPEKIKRTGEALTLDLEPTSDILAELALKAAPGQIVVGFAAETTNVIENARRKLRSKALHAIVVNDVSRSGIGFDSDRNAVTIIFPDGEVQVPETSKREVAHRVLDAIRRIREHASETLAASRS